MEEARIGAVVLGRVAERPVEVGKVGEIQPLSQLVKGRIECREVRSVRRRHDARSMATGSTASTAEM